MHNHGNHTKLLLGAVVGFVLLAALGVPVLSYLPLIALVAICPLMMFFMMRGMNHQSDSSEREQDRSTNAHRH